MKVLWVVNVKIPIISKKQGNTGTVNIGGWLDRISQGMLENNELIVCYPFNKSENGSVENLHYIGLAYDGKKMRYGTLDDIAGVEQAKNILKRHEPDIIHIHGTEFQYHWFFAEAARLLGMQNRVLASIQGLVSVYASHQKVGLPLSVIYAATPREFLGKKNIASGIKNFERRGIYEKKTIQSVKHIIGRTSWDRACTYRLNPEAEYHFGNETLREVFYSDNWKQDSFVKHRIFISQATYPVKGFHLFIEALRDIKSFYPDVTVHVSGTDLSKSDHFNGSSYGLYIMKLLKKYDLQSIVHFCGNLNAEQMKQEMLEANVFVSPSTIENSPNSVGEAMLLGVPVVSSSVGGVSDLLKDKEEGYLYQSDAPYMLAYYVMTLFNDSDLCLKIGQAAKKRASKTHNYEKNLKDLIDIYNMIAAGEE